MKHKILILVLIGTLLMTLGLSKNKVYYRAIITTDVTEDTPVNDITSIPVSSKQIVLFIYWYNLQIEKEYELKVAIFDGKKNLLTFNPVKFTPTETSWHTITTYPMNAKIDKPGSWRFEAYLNGKRMFKKKLAVKK